MVAPVTDDMAGERLRWLLRLGWLLPSGASALLIIYGLSYPFPRAISVAMTAILVGAAAFVAGALLGFLFGIPRASPATDSTIESVPRTSYSVNTNLEQISDWLTKILVGVGLIELGNIAAGLGDLLDSLEPSFGGRPGSSAVAGAVLAFFSIWGFLLCYLLTRTFLTVALRAFEVAEVRRRAVDEAVAVAGVAAQRKDEADALALSLVSLQLNRNANEDPVDFDSLVDALKKASPPVREQALLQAQVQRRASWAWGTETRSDVADDMKSRHSRTIPVFRALAEAQPNDVRILSELGYAIKDDGTPDYWEARRVLSEAMSLAQRDGIAVDWIQLNRAIAGIRLLKSGAGGHTLTSSHVYEDLAAANLGRQRIRTILTKDVEICEWLNSAGHPQFPGPSG
jgi:hypothetical protein